MCTAGFTGDQIADINHHNQLYPQTPVLLVAPIDEAVGSNIFGTESYAAIASRVGAAKNVFPIDPSFVKFNAANNNKTDDEGEKGAVVSGKSDDKSCS